MLVLFNPSAFPTQLLTCSKIPEFLPLLKLVSFLHSLLWIFLMWLILKNTQDIETSVSLLSLWSSRLTHTHTLDIHLHGSFLCHPIAWVFFPSVFYLVSKVWTVRSKLTAWSLLNISNTHPVISCRLFFCCLQRNINTALISGRFLLSEFLLLYLSYNLPGGEVIKF